MVEQIGLKSVNLERLIALIKQMDEELTNWYDDSIIEDTDAGDTFELIKEEVGLA